jgi:hypothetical protein
MTHPSAEVSVDMELDEVIELMNAKVAGAEFNGIKAFEHEPRRIRAVLLAARARIAELEKQLAPTSMKRHSLSCSVNDLVAEDIGFTKSDCTCGLFADQANSGIK